MSTHVVSNFNKTLHYMLKGAGLEFFFMPCALQRPIVESQWTITLPDNIDQLPWNKPNFRLVIHAQDFVHFHNNLCVELYWLEENLKPEYLPKVLFVHWDHDLNSIYSGPIKCIEFASHSFEIAHGLKEQYSSWQHVVNKNYFYNWLCLNGRPREHRNQVYDLLKDTPGGLLTHNIHNPLSWHPYENYNFDNIDNFVRLLPAYQNCRVSVVTESLYQDVGGIITEKTLFAIAAQHPFMCIGHRGIHQQIRDRGFCTFENLFDLSYDTEPNSTRLTVAIERNLSVLIGNIDVGAVREQTQHNFEWLMTGYADSLRERAQEQLLAAL